MNTLSILKSVPVIISINEIITKTKTTKVTDHLIKNDMRGLNPMLLHINSVGGDVPTVFSIIGTMKIIISDVYTFVSGEAMSAGALLLMSGKKGYRFANKDSIILIHYAQGNKGMNETAENFNANMNKVNKSIENIIISATGKNRSVVKKHLKNETLFTAKEALKFGMVDRLI